MDSAPFVFIQQKDKHHKHVHLTGFQSFWETHKKTKQTSKKFFFLKQDFIRVSKAIFTKSDNDTLHEAQHDAKY